MYAVGLQRHFDLEAMEGGFLSYCAVLEGSGRIPWRSNVPSTRTRHDDGKYGVEESFAFIVSYPNWRVMPDSVMLRWRWWLGSLL
jgi:hypothetical protein